MNFYEETQSEQLRIENAIKKYGYAPEHNFWWYKSQAEENSKNMFAESKDGCGLLTIEERDKKRCAVFSSPLASPSDRASIIIEYLDHIFQSGAIEKVTLELEDELYKKFILAVPTNIKVRAINYTLTWPLYNLGTFECSLSGNNWSSLRKTKNKFYKNHSVALLDAKEYEDKKSLHSIVDEWRKKRGGNDRAHLFPYHNFIDLNFKGATEARVFTVDGKACGINAGWMIPNSNIFYGALGIHNYSLPGLGDVLYLEDLDWLKNHGYEEANMGGGESELTNFKNKFRPKSFYKTHIFSVVKSKK